MSETSVVEIRGKRIRQDVYGHFCLDDIWEAAKSSQTKLPKHWRTQRAVKALEEALQKKVTTGYLKEKSQIIPAAYAKRGRGNAGTYAHPVLAAAYAGYLSPKLEIEVREVWLRYRAADAALADEILQRAPPKDNEWVAMRALSRARRVYYTETLRDHDVNGKGYWRCTNAVYRQILGADAGVLRARRGLPHKANLRDHMATHELSFVMAAESLAADRIREENRRGNWECEQASAKSAGYIREAIERDRADRQRPATIPPPSIP